MHAENMHKSYQILTSLDHREFLEKEKDPQTYDDSTDLEIYLQHFEWVAKNTTGQVLAIS